MDGIMVELILYTDNSCISMDELRKYVDINLPCKQETIGEIKYYGIMKNHKRIVDVSSLLYSTDYIKTTEVEVAIQKMSDILKPKLYKIEELINKYNLCVKFCIVIDLFEKPLIVLPADFIHMMARVSAEIEFDTYVIWNDRSKLSKYWSWFLSKRSKGRTK